VLSLIFSLRCRQLSYNVLSRVDSNAKNLVASWLWSKWWENMVPACENWMPAWKLHFEPSTFGEIENKWKGVQGILNDLNCINDCILTEGQLGSMSGDSKLSEWVLPAWQKDFVQKRSNGGGGITNHGITSDNVLSQLHSASKPQ
jgi:hypothetical protein